jgi:hypothetical protein
MEPHPINVARLARTLVTRAENVCIVSFLCAWLVATAVWAVNWVEDGPEPSGPRYNGAKHFLDNLTPLVHHTAENWTFWLGTKASSWVGIDLGTCFTVIFGLLMLALGSLQWFLLGQFARFVDAKWGPTLSGALLAGYAMWACGCLFLWLFA